MNPTDNTEQTVLTDQPGASTSESTELKSPDHEQNNNWEWSEEFTEFIHSKLEGRSLKVCTGLRPLCDLNLDIKDLNEIAKSSDAEFEISPISDSSDRLEALKNTITTPTDEDTIYGRITGKYGNTDGFYDGYACHGDAFDLPFEDNSFDTVVSDPPWLDLSTDERRSLFKEIIRVTAPTGTILYNATWIPENQHARQFELRMRQETDFWGSPSFAAFYRRTARNTSELFEAHDYTSVQRYPKETVFWSEPFHPNAVSPSHNTDPKKVCGDSDYQQYCCPMCGYPRLGHLRDDFFETDDGTYPLYECLKCKFRVDAKEVERLAAALESAATRQDISIDELSHIEYTPKCVKDLLNSPSDTPTESLPVNEHLPWVHITNERNEPNGISITETQTASLENSIQELHATD